MGRLDLIQIKLLWLTERKTIMNKTNMKRIAVVLIGIFLCSVAQVQAIDLAVTQATSTTTAVTANGGSGVITTFSETAAAGATVTFTVNNTGVKSSNAVLVSLMNYSGTWVTNGDPI